MNRSYLRWLKALILCAAGLGLLGGFALACSFVYLAPALPTAENMRTKELSVPLRIYSRSGGLVSQFGEQRRIPVDYEQIPDVVRQAVLAAEDDRFFEHHGLDWMGIVRALVTNVVSADASGQGGSTITQQAARNMFLTLDKTLRRKLSEVFVTYRMEQDFSKEQILAIYLNVAEFGHRSSGIAAAAQTYYGKRLDQLSVSQAATLVGLLPAPSRYNPITNAKAATVRRNYVIGRMHKLGFIDANQAAAAEKEIVATHEYAPLNDVDAPYVAEMVRQEVIKRFGTAAVNAGFKVYTTIDDRLQEAANRALRVGLIEYDRRHGYRGHLGKVQVPAGAGSIELDTLLGKYDSIGLLQPAVVTRVNDTSAEVHVRGGSTAKIGWDGLSWAKRATRAADIVAVGDVIHVITDKGGAAQLAQLPKAQSALVALDPLDGAIVSLVGGFDFHENNFNRATQAKRQPGSGFKPFIYSAALDSGETAASVYMDMPLVNERRDDDEENWRPENSGGGYGGAMRMRDALVRSRNLVSIRILRKIGVDAVIDHAVKFGFRRDSLPAVDSLALGVQAASPLEMVTGYATFANGGFKIEPYFINRIEDSSGKVLFEAKPKIACPECTAPPAAPPVAEPPIEPAVDANAPAVADASPEAVAIAEPAVPTFHDVDAPPALRQLARLQGGRGYLPADRVAPRVVSPQNVWIMSDIMHDVTVRGTAARSNSLGRDDLAGKTGTSNDNRDTWFNGYNHQLVATVWVGFDDEKQLGGREEGSSTALPIWIRYMQEALRNQPSNRLARPGGLIDLRVSPTTGLLANQNDPSAVFETFMIEHQPLPGEGIDSTEPAAGAKGGDSLF